ncbi:MAG: serine/threonine protein kinase, partial [Acidobacteria bacterium]|nr:serine/threonine protein kinase [Acidobacteriota bacterium]
LLRKGPLPVEETLEVCRQIAEGMEAAHEKGIIHRDLKPANVRVTPDGKVKILDFGLARALRDQAATADLSHSLTSTAETTRPGVVLGTAAYMSPEQAKGKPVDKRADIWSFGCVRKKGKNEPRKPQRNLKPARGRLRQPFTPGSGGRAVKHTPEIHDRCGSSAAPGLEGRNAKRWPPDMSCDVTPP